MREIVQECFRVDASAYIPLNHVLEEVLLEVEVEVFLGYWAHLYENLQLLN